MKFFLLEIMQSKITSENREFDD